MRLRFLLFIIFLFCPILLGSLVWSGPNANKTAARECLEIPVPTAGNITVETLENCSAVFFNFGGQFAKAAEAKKRKDSN